MNEQFPPPRFPQPGPAGELPQNNCCGFPKLNVRRVAPARLQHFSPDAFVSPNASISRGLHDDNYVAPGAMRSNYPAFDQNDDSISQVANTTNYPTNVNDVDGWIDELDVNRVDTPHPMISGISSDVQMAWLVQQSLPRVQIPDFDGSPILWVEFITKFRDMVHLPAYLTDSQRKTYLLQHVKGKAKRAVRGFANNSHGYVLALKRLKFMFGQKSTIAKAIMNNITQGKMLESDDHAGLEDFYYSISDCLVTLRQLNYASDIFSSETLRLVVSRLPVKLHNRWAEHCFSIRRKNADPNLIDLED